MNLHFKTATDFRKSLEAQLKNYASKTGIDLQRVRQKVAFDRFLARLFAEQNCSFFLKGGYAMELRFSTARATKDIDLTCIKRLNDNTHKIEDMILDELRLATSNDLGDFFVYKIGEAQIDIDNAPYGGARYPVEAHIDRKLFVRFQLDVGADMVTSPLESIQGADWLHFCGIPAPQIPMISIEQQWAEKIHCYTQQRAQGINSRTKDLIDLVLLVRLRSLNITTLKKAIHTVFKARGVHKLPKELPPPPIEWLLPYQKLAVECALSLTLDQAFQEVADFYHQISSE